MSLLVAGVVAEALDALDDAARLKVAGEVAEVRAVAALADAYRVSPQAAAASAERMVPGGADGTPLVGEFLAYEVGPRLGMSPVGAALLIERVLDLQYRHPRLWGKVLAGQIRFFQATTVAQECARAGLDAEAAQWVDARLAVALAMLPWRRAVALLQGLIVQADGALAAERARLAAQARYVRLGEVSNGQVDLVARLDARDGLFFEGQVARIAELLAVQGDTDRLEVRRAKAVGVLATPALATAMLQQAALAESAAGQPELGPASDPHACLGHLCGTITVAPDLLLPKTEVVVHVAADTVRDGVGAARVADVAGFDPDTLRGFLANTRVTVRPVVDLNEVAAVDRYEMCRRLRVAVEQRHPFEVFPFGATPSRRCDVDHTVPYTGQAPPGAGQTRLGNLGPLSRRAHRVKTHGRWRVSQYLPGRFEWTSPFGARYRVGPDGSRRVPSWLGRELPRRIPPDRPPPAPPVPGATLPAPAASGLTPIILEGTVLDAAPVQPAAGRVDLIWTRTP